MLNVGLHLPFHYRTLMVIWSLLMLNYISRQSTGAVSRNPLQHPAHCPSWLTTDREWSETPGLQILTDAQMHTCYSLSSDWLKNDINYNDTILEYNWHRLEFWYLDSTLWPISIDVILQDGVDIVDINNSRDWHCHVMKIIWKYVLNGGLLSHSFNATVIIWSGKHL